MGYHGFGFKDCHSVYVYRIILNFVIRYIHIDKYIYIEREREFREYRVEGSRVRGCRSTASGLGAGW